ncbi:MAG: MarR family transcriptional regulator [Clostridia bacterium]|nr:MarR family transcriptional regulator [Clostridia bacterium]
MRDRNTHGSCEHRHGAGRHAREGLEAECRGEAGERRSARPSYKRAPDMNGKLILCLREIGHMMRAQSDGKASQKRILIMLREAGGITQRDLTERLGIQPGSASEIIAKLEGAELVTRTPNATDRRTADIRLTEAGERLAADALEQRQQRQDEMLSCLSEEEKQALLALLEKLHEAWSARLGERARRGHGGRRGRHDGEQG